VAIVNALQLEAASCVTFFTIVWFYFHLGLFNPAVKL